MLDLFLGVKKTSKEMSSPIATVSVERDLNTIFTNPKLRITGVMFDCLADATVEECERKMIDLGFATNWRRFDNMVVFWRDGNISDDEDDDEDDDDDGGDDE